MEHERERERENYRKRKREKRDRQTDRKKRGRERERDGGGGGGGYLLLVRDRFGHEMSYVTNSLAIGRTMPAPSMQFLETNSSSIDAIRRQTL